MNANPLGRRVAAALVYALAYLLVFPVHIFALPQGGRVAAGKANITRPNQRNLHIQQATGKTIINWERFSIARPEAVRFFQPSVSSIALNRVVGVDPSTLHGLLSANGNIFLINPNGILVGPTGRIEANNFIASTLDMADRDFLQGKYTLIQDPAKPLSAILNLGIIEAAANGSVSLIAPAVENHGTIAANLGRVNLGAGEQVTLSFAENDDIRFAVERPVTGHVVRPDGTVAEDNILNTGLVSADGGEVVLTARSAFDAVKSVVNNTGVIEAKSLEARNGTIRLDGGEQGAVFNSGTLDASGLGAGETGGRVTVTGEKTALVHYSRVLASGNAGGGKVFIGGGGQGKDPEIKNGRITYVGEDAAVDADAVEEGAGGQVVVWADDTTEFGGRISARGGGISGDGGSVEVSGKKHLRITGHADLTAPNGHAGTLLLDPGSVTIQDGTDTAPPGSMDVINDGWINSQLSLGLLTVTTADSTDGLTQDITMDPTVNDDGLALSLSNTLTLTAGNDISLDGAFSGAGGLTLNANRNVTFGGTHTASGLLTVNIGQGGSGGVLNQNSVDVSSYASASAAGGAGGDTFTINAGGFDTLSGGGGGDQFDISAAGDVAASISGGAGDDVFNLDSAISGSIAGGTGGETAGDTLDFAGIGAAQSVTLTASLATNQFDGTGGGAGGGFSEISIAVGNGGTLTGEDAVSTWTLDGGPTETYSDGSNDLTFSGFAALQGGSLADTFDVAAPGAYDVSGGDGDDHFNLNASASGTLSGEGGSDTADIQTAAFDITGSGLALDVETVINSGGGTLAADSLDFGTVAGLGTVGAPLSIAVDSLSIAGSTGAVYLSEADAIDLGTIQAGASLFSLVSGGAVTDAGAAVVTAGSVSLETTGGIGTAALPLLLSAAQIDVTENGPGAGIHINNAATAGVTVSSMTIGTGDIFYGQTGNQSLLLTAVSAGDGDITITNAGGTGADIDIGSVSADTSNDTVSITAAGHIQESGTDAAADVTAATISLQAADGGIGGLAANALEINATVRFDADTAGAGGNALSIADVAGDLPLGDVVLGVNDGTLTSVGAMTDAYDGDDNLSSSGQVVLGAAAGIGAADAIETTLGTLRFTSTGGAVRIDNTGTLTLGLGASSAGGVVGLASTNGIAVAQDLSSTAGAVTLDAGTGTFTVGGGSTVTAGGASDLTVTAADIALTGNLDAAGDSVYLFPSDAAAPLYVGTAGGGWSLTTAEVQNVTATTLVVGRTGSQTGTILIDDLNDSGGAISTNFEFYADGGSGSVVFGNAATNTDQQPASTSRLFVQADDIQVDAGITAADRIEMITTNGGDLRFTSGVTVTNGNQEIDLDTIAGSIDLAVAGGTVTLDAPQGSVRLDDVVDPLADDTNLTVSAGGDVTVGSANVGAGTLAIRVDSDNNTNFHTGTFGALTAGTLTVNGGTDGGGNERFFFNGGINAGSLTVIDGAVATVGADIQTTAGDIDFSDVPSFVLGAGASVTLDTNGTGDVLFGAAVDGTATGNEALIVDTRDGATGGGIDGNVSLGTVGTTAGSGTELGLFSVLADTGTITLNGNVYSSANGSRSGAVTFGSTVALTADTVINTDGGAYDSSGTETVSSGGPWNLSVTTTDGIGTAGGSVSLGAFGNNGGLNQYVSSVAVDSTDTGSSGTVTLNEDILLENHVGAGAAADFTIAGSPRVIISDDTGGTALTIDTEQDNADAPGIANLGSGNLSADAAGYTLQIRTTDTTAGGTSGGDVTLGPVNSVGGSFFLTSLRVDATSTNGNDGTIHLEGNIATDEGAVVLAGDVDVGVAGTLTVSTEQGSDGPAGDIDLSGAAVGATNTLVNLTLNAGTVGGAGGTATLGSFEPPTGLNRINDLTVFTFGTTDGAINVPSALTVDGAVRFSSAARVDIDSDLTAGNAGSGALTIQDTAEVLIDASAARTITAAGAINMDAANDGVSQITLDDGGSLVTLTSGGSVRLAPLRADTAPVQATGAGLTVEADGSATLSGVDLDGAAADGSLSVTVDADTGGVETLTMDGAVTRVAGITLGGDASDDTVDINAAMTAGAGLTVQNAQTIDIASGLTLTAQGGALDLNTGVGGIVLGGGSTTRLQTEPGDGAVALADVSGAGDNLTVSSTSAVTLGSIDLSGGNLSVTVDSDDDSGALTLAVASAVTHVGNVTLQGGTGGADGSDDVIDIDQSLTAGGYLTVGRAEEVQLLGGTTLEAQGGALTMSSVGATGITLNGGGTVALQTTTTGDFDVDLASVTSGADESLTVSSRGDVDLQGAVDLGAGDLDVTFDSNTGGAEAFVVDQTITANNIDITAGGAADADMVDINTGITAAGHLSIDTVEAIDIASDLTLEAMGGALDLSTDVGRIVLGAAGAGATPTRLQTSTATGTDVSLAPVAGAGDDLVVSAVDNASLSTVDLSGGDLTVTVDSDGSGALTLAISAAVSNVGDILLQGVGIDDTIDIDQSLTAAGRITVQNAEEIQLAGGIALAAQGGNADLNNSIGATGITLDGAGTVTVQTAAADNDVELASVTGSGGGQSLTVSSTRDVALSTVDLSGGSLSVTVDSDNDAGAVSTLSIAGAVSNVDNVTLRGGGAGADEIVDIDQNLTAAGFLTVENVEEIQLLAGTTLEARGGAVDLNNNIGSAGITLNGTGTVTVQTSGAENDVQLAPVSGSGGGQNLTVSATRNATLSTLDLAGGDLSVTIDSDDDSGALTLAVGSGIGNVGSITLQGGTGGVDGSNDVIDVNQSLTAGGSITIRNAEEVQLLGGITLNAQGGDAAINTNIGATGITLGGTGTVTVQTTGGGDNSVLLAGVTSGTNESLTLSAEGGVDLQGAVDLGTGDLNVTVDSNTGGTETLVIDQPLTARNIALTAGGAADGDEIDINQNVTAGGALKVNDVAAISVADVTLEARGGALDVATGVGGVFLDGGTGAILQTTTAGDFAVDVAAVTSTGGENLTISSRGNASLQGPVNLGTGNLDITIDSNADSTNSLSVGQAITATHIDLSAGGAANGDTIFISQGVSAGGHLMIDNVQTVDIASGLTLEAAGGSLDLNDSVGGIVIGTGGITILQTTTADSNVELAAVAGAGDDLTISATADAVLSAIDLSGGDLSVTVDSDDDSGALTLAVTSAVTNVGNLTLQGGTGGTDGSDDIIDIDRSLTAAGSLTVQNADEIQLLAGKTLTAEGGNADLNNNIGAGITLNGAGAVTVQTTTADNDVELAAVAGSGGGQSLTVSSTRDVALSTVDLAGGSLSVTVDSDNDAGAVSTLAVANTVTNVGSVTLQGGGVGSDDIIDVDQAITSAGYQLFQLVSGVQLSNSLTTSGGAVTFRSPVTLDGNASVDTTDGGGSAGAAIGFNSTLDGARSLELTAGVGALAFQGAIGSGTPLGDLTVVSAASVTTGGVLNAASVDIQDGGAVDLNGAIAAPGGFSSRGTTFDNTGGPIDTASGTGAITVNHTGAVTIGGALSSASGAVDIDSTGSTVALYQGVATTDGGVAIDASGATTVSGGGNISTGAGSVAFGSVLAGALSTAGNITTGGGGVTLSRNTTLAGNISISTGTGGGDILFSGTLDGTAAGAQSLTLTAGTGRLTFDGIVGATRLGALTVNSAAGSAGDYNGDPSLATATISINAALAADSVDITDGGNVAVNGAVSAPGGFSSAGTGYFDNTGGSITTSGAPVTIRHTDAAYGTVTIAAAIDTGNGGTVNGGDVAIDGGYEVIVDALIDTRTDSGTLGSLTVGGGVTINTSPILGAGSVDLNKNITATQDRVIVSTLVDSSNSISITAPRDIIIGALVQTTAPGADVILTADSIGNGQGGVLLLDGGQVVSARDVVISGSDLYATGAGFAPFDAVVVEADSGGNPQIRAGRNIELKIRPAAPAGADIVVEGVLEAGISDAAGFIDMDAADQIHLATALSTTGGNLVFRDPVLLGGDTQVDSAGGNILFSGTLDGTAGTEALGLTAGAGNITFSGDVGVGTVLGDVAVVSVHDLLAGSRFRSISLNQAGGNGTSRFDGAVALTGGFNLQTGAVDINHNVSTDGGAVTLSAAAGVDLAAGRTISTTAAVGDSGAVDIVVTGAGSVNLAGDLVTAGGSGVAAGSGGQVDITTNDGAVTVGDITTSGGDASGAAANGGNAGAIHIATAGAGGNDNLTLAGTLTASGGAPGAGGSAGSDGNVILVSVDSLVDGNGGTNNVAGGALTIDAVDGIGSNDPIETAVSSLDLVNTAFGNVRINEADDVDVVRIDQNASGTVTLLTTAGSITLTGGGSGVSAAGGAIRLDAGGANADLSVNQTVTSAGSGAITLEAGDAVFFSSAGDVTAGGASDIRVAAGADGGAGDSGGVVFMANGAVADAGSGAIAVSSVGDVTLGSLATSSTSSSAVVVVSSGGSIIDGGDSPAYDVDAQRGRVAMTAAGGIGDANPLEIRASSADAHATAPGNIRLDAVGDLVLRDVDTTRGTISVSTTGGSLNAQDVQAGGGRNVDLSADGDLILGTVSAGVGQMTLFSGGNIDRGTITADRATLTAQTAGLSRAVTIDVNENRLFVNLAGKNTSGVSGVFDKGPALNAKPPKANLVALGTVIFEGLGTFLAGELADIEGAITSLATASKEQEILDEMLRAAREAQYFMTAPLEIFIEMEEEEKDKRKEENEAFNRLLPDPGHFFRPHPAAVRPSLLSDTPVPRPPGLIPDADGTTFSGIRLGNSLDRSVASLTR